MPVYFIECGPGGPIKIGYAANPWQRRADLQTASPHELRILAVIPGDRAKEQGLHARFEKARARGEWFERAPELVAFIEGVIAGQVEPPKELPVDDFDSLFGFDENMLDAIVGYLDGRRDNRRANQLMCESVCNDLLDVDTVAEVVALISRIESHVEEAANLNGDTQARGYAFVCRYQGDPAADSDEGKPWGEVLFGLRDLLDRHHMVIAERRLTEELADPAPHWDGDVVNCNHPSPLDDGTDSVDGTVH